jgi:molybdate-binding protein
LSTIAGTDDPLIAESSVAEAIASGRADALCVQIARRASGVLVRIEVVEERHDVVARAKHESSLVDRQVKAACEVE